MIHDDGNMRRRLTIGWVLYQELVRLLGSVAVFIPSNLCATYLSPGHQQCGRWPGALALNGCAWCRSRGCGCNADTVKHDWIPHVQHDLAKLSPGGFQDLVAG